jgi:hypothetical protein
MADVDTEPKPGEVFTDLREWMAAMVLLHDRGLAENLTLGDDEDSRRFVAEVRRRNKDWEPGLIPVVPPRRAASLRPQAMPQPQPRAAVPRARERRATGSRARLTRAGPDDDPDLERTCEVCGGTLAGKRRHAKTCSTRCRVALHRRGLQPKAELLERYEAALPLRQTLAPDERLDLLAAVVWPSEAWHAPWLREAA